MSNAETTKLAALLPDVQIITGCVVEGVLGCVLSNGKHVVVYADPSVSLDEKDIEKIATFAKAHPGQMLTTLAIMAT